MSAISFPNPTSNNPATGASYGDGWYNDQNGVTYSYANNVWSAVTEPNASLDARYVEVAGDDMTGNLTLGTDKIKLDATTGSVTAAGNIDAGSVASDKYASLKATGRATFLNADNGQYVWINESNGSAAIVVNDSNASTPASAKFSVTKEGSITAAGGDFEVASTGQVLIDADNSAAFRIRNKSAPSAGNQITLRNDGSAEFAGDVTAGDFFDTTKNGSLLSYTGAVMARQTNGAGVIWQGLLGNTQTSKITADGTITATGYSMASLSQL